LCQYNSQIHRVPAGRIVTNKQTNKQTSQVIDAEKMCKKSNSENEKIKSLSITIP
jgi:hypothetical protein